MTLEPPIPPNAPPEPPAATPRLAYGLQVAYGFFLPAVAWTVAALGQGVFGWLVGRWFPAGMFISGVLGILTLVAGVRLAMQRSWRGVLLGFILFGAVILLLIGLCFAILAGLGK
jgi:hypothetical protein